MSSSHKRTFARFASGIGASAVLAAGLIVSPGIAQAANYTFTITTAPPVSGAGVGVTLLDPDGWDRNGYYSQTSSDGTWTGSISGDPQQTPTYRIAVTAPAELSDDSAPFLQVGPLADVTETVVLPAPNLRYVIEDPDGQPVSGVYVGVARPIYDQYQNQVGSSTIFNAPATSSGRFGMALQEGNSAIDAYPGEGWIATFTPPPNSGLAPLTISDTFDDHSGSPRVVTLPRPNVRAIVQDPDGGRYENAQVRLVSRPTADQWCQGSQIAYTPVASSGGNGTDDTFNAYTDASISPAGYRISLIPAYIGGLPDTSVVQTDFDFTLADLSESTVRELRFDAPNVVLTVLGDDNAPLANAQVHVNAQDGSDPCFFRYATSGADGSTYFKLPFDHDYRITVFPPQGSSQLQQTFMVSGASLAAGTGTLQLLSPNVTGSVDDSAGNDLPGAFLEFRAYTQDGWLGDYLGNTTADSNGDFAFVVNPDSVPYGLAITASDQNGWETGVAKEISVNQANLPASGLTIRLNPANFAGTILGSDGNPLSQTWMNAQAADGTQVPGVVTNDNGEFAMYVPGDVSATAPLVIGTWLQGEQRYVQREVAELVTDFVWQIPAVNLMVEVTADGQPAAGAQVSLLKFNGAYDEWVDGGQTDNSGIARFAVDDTTVEYVVEVQPGAGQSAFATGRATATPSDIGSQTGLINVSLAQPNAEVLVTGPVGANGAMEPLQDAYVWVYSLDTFEGVGAVTSSDGKARLLLDDTTGLFGINASAPYQYREALTDARAEMEFDVVNGIATAAIELTNPNVTLSVRQPNSQAPLRHAQIEVRNAGEAWGATWASANNLGNLGLTLEPGDYDLVVTPSSWETGMSAFGAKTYWVQVTDEGVEVRVDDVNGTPVALDGNSGAFILEPSAATYSGTVQRPNAEPVANSWVEVQREVTNGIDTWYEWIQGVGTGRDGTFGMTLEDDTYVLNAQPVWGDRAYAPSERCNLVIAGGVDVTASSGLANQCGSTLTLRAPNLAFIVRDPADNSPVTNAWVCPTNTTVTNCVSSGRDGKVTFFIDDTGSIAGGNLDLRLEAPWGSTGLASTTTQINVSDIGTSAWTDGSQSVMLASPNVTAHLWRDDSTAGNEVSDGWVSIFTDDGNFTWIGGSNVNRQGTALFNVDDTSGLFCIDAWPGWGSRQKYGPIQECGVSLADGRVDLVFRSANVKATVLDADGRTNAYGWVEITGANNFRGGSSLDERGRIATYLTDGDYTFTFYPAYQRSGTPTVVNVSVAGGVPNIASQITLDSGNVSGEVRIGGTLTEGVVVVASPVSAGAEIVAVTDADGTFRMSLADGDYTISTVAPPGAAGTPVVSVSDGGSLSGTTLTVGS